MLRPAYRYKQLLLKQRDIMIALTARLNERDEQIMTLQVRLKLQLLMMM
jgi:kinesin family protein 3/17